MIGVDNPVMGRNVHRRHGDNSHDDAGDAEAVRALILARLHRRGWTLERIAKVLGSSPSTVHRRLRELTPAVRAELEAADVGAVI
jgi:AraC-like DNA-binding protein